MSHGALRPPTSGELLKEYVFDELREAILHGDLAPGQRLRDAELEVWLGASRTPVRGALDELKRIGMVEVSPSRYTIVARTSLLEGIEALHAAGLILSAVARETMPALRADAQHRLLGQASALSDAAERSPEEADMELLRFSRALLEQCPSRALTHALKGCLDALLFKSRAVTAAGIRRWSSQSFHLLQLRTAIQTRDGLRAACALASLHESPPPWAPGKPPKIEQST